MGLRDKLAVGIYALSVLSLTDCKIKTNFTSVSYGLHHDKHHHKHDEEFKVMSYYDNGIEKKYFFCRGEKVKLKFSVDLGKDAERLSELTTADGEPFFDCDDIARYVWYGGKYDFAKRMSEQLDENGKNRFYGAQLPQFSYLGLSIDEIENFNDTSKPNSLIVFPTFDYSKDPGDKEFGRAFSNDKILSLLKDMMGKYDVKVTVASSQQEVCDAIDPKLNFVTGIITGHGTDTSLREGKPCTHADKNCNDDDNIINTKDKLSSCLDNFVEDAVIFLNSCSTGEGGSLNPHNLANTLSLQAPGRTFISSKVGFSTDNLIVKSIYPFDVRIVVDDKDQTYKAKDGKEVLKSVVIK